MAPQHEDIERHQPPTIMEESEETESESETDDEASGDGNTRSSDDGSINLDDFENENTREFWENLENNTTYLAMIFGENVPLGRVRGLNPRVDANDWAEDVDHPNTMDYGDGNSSSSAEDGNDEVMVDENSDESDISDLESSDDEEVPNSPNRDMERRMDDDSEATASSTEDEDEELTENNTNVAQATVEATEVRDANDFNSDEDPIPTLFNFDPRPTEEEKALNLSQEELGNRRERRFWFALQNFFSDNEEKVVPKKAKLTEPERAPEPEDTLR